VHRASSIKVAGFCRKGATPIVVDIKGMFDPEIQGRQYFCSKSSAASR